MANIEDWHARGFEDVLDNEDHLSYGEDVDGVVGGARTPSNADETENNPQKLIDRIAALDPFKTSMEDGLEDTETLYDALRSLEARISRDLPEGMYLLEARDYLAASQNGCEPWEAVAEALIERDNRATAFVQDWIRVQQALTVANAKTAEKDKVDSTTKTVTRTAIARSRRSCGLSLAGTTQSVPIPSWRTPALWTRAQHRSRKKPSVVQMENVLFDLTSRSLRRLQVCHCATRRW